MKLAKVLLVVPAVLLFSLVTAVTAFAAAATIQAQFSCTQAGRVCFNLTVSTMDFPSVGRDVNLTLLGHKAGDPAGTLTTISQTFTVGASSTSITQLHLDSNLDGAQILVCFHGVTTAGFDSFVLRINAIEVFTVNGKQVVDLGPFTNNCPTASSPSPTPSATPSPTPRASPSASPAPTPTPTGAALAQTGANPPGAGIALGLVVLGLLAMGAGVFAWRRRPV